MTNGRIVDIENEVLRNRLSDVKGGALTLIDTIERYAFPTKESKYCSRSELQRVKEELKKKLK